MSKAVALILSLIVILKLYGQLSSTTSDDPVQIENLSAYIDTTNNQSPENIISEFTEGKFKSTNNSILNSGIAKYLYWFHFTVTNKNYNPSIFLIEVQNSRLNQIELFSQNEDRIESLGKLGDFYPFSERKIPHKNFLYEVNLKEHETKSLFLRADQKGHAFVMPISVYAKSTFTKTSLSDYLFSGIIYGILFFVAVISLVFFANTKQWLYFFYGVYLLTAIVWFLSYFGVGYQYLWGNYPAFNTGMAPAMAAINIVLNIQICEILLKVEKNNYKHVVALAIKAALIIIAVLALFGDLNGRSYDVNHTYLIIFLFAILAAMTFLIEMVVVAYKGEIAARFYFWASVLKAGSIMYLALLELGIARAFPRIEEMLEGGIFLEIFLFTLALAKRYTDFREKTFVRVIQAHEKERLALSHEIHDGISSSLTVANLTLKKMLRVGKFDESEKEELELVSREIYHAQMEAVGVFRGTLPDYIKDNKLTESTTEYIEKIQARVKANPGENAPLNINFSFNEEPENFSAYIKLNLFRIIQEIVVNILKHSKATEADIVLSFDKKEVLLIAEDNGIGFHYVDNALDDGHGLGNIKSRVASLDGSIKIKSTFNPDIPMNEEKRKRDSSSEHGTSMHITIPNTNQQINKRYDYDYPWKF